MAKQRYINTKIWEDSWFASLDQIEQLVFIYFLTNPMTNIVGVYELSKGTISRAVGLETRMLEEILERFERSGKVYYRDGWVVLPNFIKHQNYKSPKIQKGIEIELKDVPDRIKSLISIPYPYGTDTLSHSNSNSNLIKSNSIKQIAKPDGSAGIVELIHSFEKINPAIKRMYGNKTQRGACERLIKEFGLEIVLRAAKVAISVLGVKYAPKITTPYELETNWTKLSAFVKENKEPKNKVYTL